MYIHTWLGMVATESGLRVVLLHAVLLIYAGEHFPANGKCEIRVDADPWMRHDDPAVRLPVVFQMKEGNSSV